MSETCPLNRAKKAAPFLTGLVLVLTVAAVGGTFACSPAPAAGSWSGPGGLAIDWTPAQPRFGDLVTVTARFPLDAASDYAADFPPGSDPGRGLFNPQGGRVLVRSTQYEGTGAKVLWIFRVTDTGNWTWGKAGKLLWTTKTEAGEATELKSFDAPGLWEGRTVAANPAPPGGSALPAAQPLAGGPP